VHPGLFLAVRAVNIWQASCMLMALAGIQEGRANDPNETGVTSQATQANHLQLSGSGRCVMARRMCYLFCRCTRSVSICPPAYYAHLAAFRGRALCLHADDSSDSASDVTSQSGRGVESPVEFMAIHPRLNNTMVRLCGCNIRCRPLASLKTGMLLLASFPCSMLCEHDAPAAV